MTIKSASVVAIAAILAGVAAQPAAAQQGGGYGAYGQGQYQGQSRFSQSDNAYRSGYRAGYQAGRIRGRYDDRPIRAGYGQPNAYGGGDPNARWSQRYGQTYSYNDDRYYQECRTSADPAGVIAGALIGGLLGNGVGRGGGRAGATVAGVIIGGAAGVALTIHLGCEDRSYAYKTYSDGFNSGRPNSDWEWDNPDNGHYGDFRVGAYYNDPDGFRCANYTQQIYVEGSPQVSTGRACQQPDGSWTIVA